MGRALRRRPAAPRCRRAGRLGPRPALAASLRRGPGGWGAADESVVHGADPVAPHERYRRAWGDGAASTAPSLAAVGSRARACHRADGVLVVGVPARLGRAAPRSSAVSVQSHSHPSGLRVGRHPNPRRTSGRVWAPRTTNISFASVWGAVLRGSNPVLRRLWTSTNAGPRRTRRHRSQVRRGSVSSRRARRWRPCRLRLATATTRGIAICSSQAPHCVSIHLPGSTSSGRDPGIRWRRTGPRCRGRPHP